MIDIKNLKYNYKSFEKRGGLKGSLRDLFSRKYRQIPAVKDVSLRIPQGEMVGLLGKNGAGKSTLIKLMCGLLFPSDGTVSIHGFTPYNHDKRLLKRVSVVFGQKSQLVWDLPPYDTLLMLQAMYKIPPAQFDSDLSELTKMLSVADLLYKPVRKLSLGERMKFEIIAAMIYRPDVLFLDEPTIGLDIESQIIMHGFLRRINKERNATIIITSHYMKDIEALADRLVIIHGGEIICDEAIISIQSNSPELSLEEAIMARYSVVFDEKGQSEDDEDD